MRISDWSSDGFSSDLLKLLFNRSPIKRDADPVINHADVMDQFPNNTIAIRMQFIGKRESECFRPGYDLTHHRWRFVARANLCRHALTIAQEPTNGRDRKSVA